MVSLTTTKFNGEKQQDSYTGEQPLLVNVRNKKKGLIHEENPTPWQHVEKFQKSSHKKNISKLSFKQQPKANSTSPTWKSCYNYSTSDLPYSNFDLHSWDLLPTFLHSLHSIF